MRVLIVAFTLCMALPGKASTCEPGIGQCAYYKCLSNRLGCQAKDYPMYFAAYYCKKFSAEFESFTPTGRAFLQSVRVCLQQEMEDDIRIQTCQDTALHAQEHHIKCYHEAHFCELPLYDKLLISKMVSPTLSSDWQFQITGLKINLDCLSH
jgi:hypothetical protein